MADGLSVVGNYASIFGFLGTVALAFITSRLRREVMVRHRIPQLRKDLSQLSFLILAILKSWPKNAIDAPSLIARLEASIKNIEEKLPRSERQSLTELKIRVSEYRSLGNSKLSANATARTALWNIQESVDGYCETLLQKENDLHER